MSVTTLIAAITLLAPLSAHAAAAACTFVAPEVAGGFTERTFTDFRGVRVGQNALQFLQSNGYNLANYPVEDAPVHHAFTQNNVQFGDGTLNLKVNGYGGSGYIEGAEIATNDKFQYASVRTVQKSSSTPGIVEGNFFYAGDNQEIDWEVLTSTIDTSSACVPQGIWATIQRINTSSEKTSRVLQTGFDPRADFHEYRIDWLPSVVIFYIDGREVTRITENLPSVAGPWIWNVWSNGDPCWSNGPPTQDSITQIRTIEIYKGYVDNVSGITCEI